MTEVFFSVRKGKVGESVNGESATYCVCTTEKFSELSSDEQTMFLLREAGVDTRRLKKVRTSA